MRRKDWQERFAAFAEARASKPFAWGSNDCCTFAAGAVEAITGVNPMASVSDYGNELAAARLIKEGDGLHSLATSLLGEPVSPLMAGVGDVVLLINEGREMLGVCNGTSALAPGADGTAVLPMNAASTAWKI